MKILKNLLLLIAILMLAIWLGSFAINEKWHFEKSITINAPAEKIYPLTAELKSWEKWSPWQELDSNAKWTFSDSTSGVGAWYSWKSEKREVGSGKLTITSLIPNQSNQYKLEFEGMPACMAGFTFTPDGNGTKVTWYLDGENHGVSKYMSLLMGFFVGEDYEKGLNNIKKLAEQ